MKLLIVGGGVVGTATCLGFRAHGHEVTVADVRNEVLARFDPLGVRVCQPRQMGEADAQIFLICVQTPQRVDGSPNLRYVRSAARSVGRVIRCQRGSDDYPIVVLRSTVLPWTTRNVVIPILERASGLQAGRDFGVCANPEFLRAATALEDFLNPRIVLLGGEDARMLETLKALHAPWRRLVRAVPLEVAEAAKVANNVFNAARISTCNQLRLVFNAAGVDPKPSLGIASHTAQSFWDPMYGLRPRPSDGEYLYPFGGTCLPKETRALLEWAKRLGVPRGLVEGILQINDHVAHLEKRAIVS